MPFALELYDYRLDVLEDRNSWEEKLPTGLSILRDKGIDTIEILEGMCHQDRSIAKLILNDFPGAWDDVQKAVDLFSKNDRLYNVIDTYHGYIQDAAGLEKWEYVLTAWSDFEKYFASGKRAITKESFPKIIDILRENMLANVNLRKYESAMDASNQLIKLEHDIGYNDSKTKVDYETNDTLKKGLKKLMALRVIEWVDFKRLGIG
jgi:tetratricopeptide (TPR) repeat protein